MNAPKPPDGYRNLVDGDPVLPTALIWFRGDGPWAPCTLFSDRRPYRSAEMYPVCVPIEPTQPPQCPVRGQRLQDGSGFFVPAQPTEATDPIHPGEGHRMLKAGDPMHDKTQWLDVDGVTWLPAIICAPGDVYDPAWRPMREPIQSPHGTSPANMWMADSRPLLAEIERLKTEVDILRRYGNKDCTAMADQAIAASLKGDDHG